MQAQENVIVRFVRELRRRRVFRTAGLYVVGAWLVIQAADVFFPAWGIPEAAKNVLLTAAVLGFPLALLFGWLYDLTPRGIVRTPPRDADTAAGSLALQRRDLMLLSVIGLVAGFILYDAAQEIVEGPIDTTPDRPANSIAVLPFTNISNDPDNEAFCDGISEEILHRLGLFRDLHIIGRTSSFAFKGSDYGIPQIAETLGVRYLLQGSVRKHGNDIRISAQLVDETGAQRWSDTFDRQLENIFDIQSEIAEVVATTVFPQVAAAALDGYEPDIEAFEQFLAGRERLHKRDVSEALALLESAVELDPGFAEAHAELAIAWLIGSPGTNELARADQAIETALTLQPGMPRALAARGLRFLQQGPPDPAAAETVLRLALEQDPNSTDAMNWLSNALGQMGNEEEASRLMYRALALDPLHGAIAVNMARRYAERGEVDRAERTLRRLTEIPDPGLFAFVELRELYGATGQLVKVNGLAKRHALVKRGRYFDLATSYAVFGRWDQADYWIRRYNEARPDNPFAGYNLSAVPFWRGDYGEAARILRDQFEARGVRYQDTFEFLGYYYGRALSLSGDHAAAIGVFETLLPDGFVDIHVELDLYNELQTLAWTLQQTGRREEAAAILDGIGELLETQIDSVAYPLSGGVHGAALNALLQGRTDLALERLERAVELGWREVYLSESDPRWTALKDNERYQAVMAAARADVDRQRAIVERIDAEEDFISLLDATWAGEAP
jgi:TolB-like protein/Flp pilus assembly protein TadD